MSLYLTYLKPFLVSFVYALVLHEGGHYITSLLMFRPIKFSFGIGWLFKFIPIPRFTWNNPVNASRFKLKLINIAGFGTEFAAIPVMMYYNHPLVLPYSILAAVHFITYPFYAGECSDFQSLI